MGSGYEIARAIEHLIHDGHPPAEVWKYTPRQMHAWIDLGYRRRCGEQADLLGNTMLGAQGDAKAIKARLKKLTEESA